MANVKPPSDILLWFGPESATFTRLYHIARREGRIAICVGTPDNPRCLPFEAADVIRRTGVNAFTIGSDDDLEPNAMNAFIDRYIEELRRILSRT